MDGVRVCRTCQKFENKSYKKKVTPTDESGHFRHSNCIRVPQENRTKKIYVYEYLHGFIYVYMYIYIYMYTHTHTHTHTHKYRERELKVLARMFVEAGKSKFSEQAERPETQRKG